MLIGLAGKKQHGKNTVAKLIRAIDHYSTGIPSQLDAVLQPNEFVRFDQDVPPGRFQEKAFAQVLKQIGCMLLGCKMSDWEDPEFKDKSLGEEWVRYELEWSVKEYDIYKNLVACKGEFYSTREEAEQRGNEIVRTYDHQAGSTIDWMEIRRHELTPRQVIQLFGTEGGRNLVHPNIWVNALFSKYREDMNWIITDVRFPNEAQAIKDRGGILIKVHRPHTYSSSDTHSSETALDDYKDWDHMIMNDGTIEELENEVIKFCIATGIISNAFFENMKRTF